LNIVILRATAKTPQARYPDVFSIAADFRRGAQLDRLGAGAQPAPAFPRGDGGDGQLSPDERTSTLPLTLHLEPENPYKGLRPFDEADAADFFGREELITTLVEHLSGTEMLSRFLAVVGPSGSGKSSLVNAGLLPAIRDGYVPGSGRWYLARMLPGADPLGELESALLRVAADPVENLDARLRADSMGLHEVLNDLLPDEETHLLLYVDQFEEVFTQTMDERARAHFLDLLYTAISARGSRFHLIITLRADFYDRPFLYPGFGDLVRWCTEIVMPLTSTDLVRAIVRPAERVGMVVEEALVAAIVAEVNEQPGALPLLQYALTELFERKRAASSPSRPTARRGESWGALARRAEELYNSLDVTGQTAVRQLFLRLIGLEDGVSDTRRRAHWAEVKDLHRRRGGAAMQALVDLYGRYRLLTFDRDPQTREPTVEVAHEALIREWRRLRIWLDQTREDLIVQRRLTEAMADWRNAGRDPSYLARGSRLTQFEALVERQSLAFNEDERAYVAASVALRRRSTLVARLSGVSLGLFSVLALTLAVVAYDGQRRAESEARISRSRELAVTGLTNVKDTDLALLLSLEALRSADTYEARNSLLSALQAYPYVERYLTGSVESVRAVAYSPDGRLVASAGRSTAIRVWDPASGAMVRRVESGHVDWINSLAFSPDGRFLASASADDTIQLWAVGGEAVLESVARLEGHTDDVWAVAFSPDGSLLASAGADGRVLLWSTETRQRVAALDGHTDVVYSLAFQPGWRGPGLSGGADEQIILWNVSTHELLGEPLIGIRTGAESGLPPGMGLPGLRRRGQPGRDLGHAGPGPRPPGVFSGHTGWVRRPELQPEWHPGWPRPAPMAALAVGRGGQASAGPSRRPPGRGLEPGIQPRWADDRVWRGDRLVILWDAGPPIRALVSYSTRPARPIP
jgi:WD40 repeat protein/energy-coupling factor transporter ATP-binding protein EcfA2